MSKWVDENKFENFKNQKKGESENENSNTGGFYFK